MCPFSMGMVSRGFRVFRKHIEMTIINLIIMKLYKNTVQTIHKKLKKVIKNIEYGFSRK